MELTHENYLELKKQKLTRAQIAEKFCIPDWKLKKHIQSQGWGRKVPKYQYNFIFDNLDESSAYWAGFLYADGCVDSKNRVRLMLQLSDIEHIRKFQQFCGAEDFTIVVSKDRNRASLEFTSTEMCQALAKYNIVPNKTLSQEPPSIDLLGKYLPDFLRGLFDGDGTICETFSNKNSKTATLYTGFAINHKGMSWIDHVLNKIVGVSYKRHERENHNNITLNTLKSIKLLGYLYKNSAFGTRLDRKYMLYNDIVLLGNRKTR